MLLHLYKVPEALFITVTVITVLFALAKTNSGKAGKAVMLAGIGLGLALAVLRAVTHEFPVNKVVLPRRSVETMAKAWWCSSVALSRSRA